MIDPRNYQAPPNLLGDRVILVTGAGAGIGRALSKACAAHGATVLLLGRTVSKLEETYDEILAGGHPQPAICPLDLGLAQGPAYDELTEKIDSEYGRLDGLVHNASLLGDRTPIEQYDIGKWQTVMHVNVNAAFHIDSGVPAASEACQGCVHHIHLERRWPHRARLLGRVRSIQIRHRGPQPGIG